MWWFIIGYVVFIVILGKIGSTLEQKRDKEFREQTTEHVWKLFFLTEWMYGKNKKD